MKGIQVWSNGEPFNSQKVDNGFFLLINIMVRLYVFIDLNCFLRWALWLMDLLFLDRLVPSITWFQNKRNVILEIHVPQAGADPVTLTQTRFFFRSESLSVIYVPRLFCWCETSGRRLHLLFNVPFQDVSLIWKCHVREFLGLTDPQEYLIFQVRGFVCLLLNIRL